MPAWYPAMGKPYRKRVTLCLFFAKNRASVTLFFLFTFVLDLQAMEKRFENIAVVLVRPAGPLNIGSAARAMRNTGFDDLVLVAPHSDRTKEAYNMAVSSADLLDRARCVKSLDDALSDRQTAFGITARPRYKRGRLTLQEAGCMIRDLVAEGQKIALVFGPEDKGLNTEEIDRCQHQLGIPAHSDLTSYNLAQAVLLVCHALFMSLDPVLEEVKAPVPATHEERGRVETRTLELLKAAKYLTPNRERVLLDMMRRIVHRAPLESRDIRNILAIIRHVKMRM
jgi:tRNA/rRNA methyltransferase